MQESYGTVHGVRCQNFERGLATGGDRTYAWIPLPAARGYSLEAAGSTTKYNYATGFSAALSVQIPPQIANWALQSIWPICTKEGRNQVWPVGILELLDSYRM